MRTKWWLALLGTVALGAVGLSVLLAGVSAAPAATSSSIDLGVAEGVVVQLDGQPVAEAVVRQRLFDYTRDKTLILITHKAPMLDLVDRLIVLDEGRVVLDGEKDKVLAALQGENKS